MMIFLCESRFDGILCGVYAAYESRLPAADCRLELAKEYEPELFAEYREVELDGQIADKVSKTIRDKMSEDALAFLHRASLHKSRERAEWIYRFIRRGLQLGKNVLKNMQEPAVYEIFKMNRNVGNEAHQLLEFVRFKKLSNGLYYGKIGPENDVLELISGHFADRLSCENWLLYDEKHRKASVHSAGAGWVIAENLDAAAVEKLENMAFDDEFVTLWKTFFDTIAIKERENARCQMNFLPLRYREYMTEFQ